MELTEIYEKGKALLKDRDIGFLLDGVETEFVMRNNRRIMDRYTFRQRCIDGVEVSTQCSILGVELASPVIMSAMTMPIPAIVDNGLMEVAEGLKAAGSLMWTGTPIPQNLKDIVSMGVPLAANVKPFDDRKKMFQAIDEIQAAGVQWVGIEVDAGQGTKVKDRQMASDCTPLALKELKEIREKVSLPLIFKGVLSREDAIKSIDAGADGILVSNHGAHTLDYLPHPFQVMDGIVQVARGKTVIMVDGGFRRGSDILKGLSFGASLVGLGRPILYALASYGRDGILVSNHGAHTLDYLPHPLQVMDEIVQVARGKTVIMVDGGFRRGSDILKGLSFGASLVGLGRPILYALASYGRDGIKALIEEITNELKRLMSMVGAPDPGSVNRDVLIEG